MRLFVLFTVLLFGALPSLTAETTTSLEEDRRQTLKYGIDPDLIELMGALKQEKNTQFLPELKQVFHQTKNPALQEQIVLFFLDLKQTGLEEEAVNLLAAPDSKGNSLLLSTVSYLTEMKALSSKDRFVTLMDDKNKTLALAAIRALGKLGATDQAQKLVEKLQAPDTDPDFKPDLIWSLGEMKAAEAADALIKEYDASDSSPFNRQSLLEAYGKIADPKFWPQIEKALVDPNVLVRSKAYSCLAGYPNQEGVLNYLNTGLKDAQPQVRQAAAESAGALKLESLKDLLVYRIRKDPEPKVRTAALKALVQYDQAVWKDALYDILLDKKTDPGLWKETVTLMMDKKPAGLKDVLLKVLERDGKDKLAVTVPQMSALFLGQKETDYKDLYSKLLQSANPMARSFILRAINAQGLKEMSDQLKTMALKDEDPTVKALASSILRGWGVTP